MNSPMNTVQILAKCASPAKILLVMLPGAYDAPKDFLKQGFVDIVHRRQLNIDVLLLDAHIGYYTSQQIIERLQNEVIAPAKARGYQQIWLAGISLGGYGSLLYSMRGAHGVDGIFIMAPFMGSRHLPAEISHAGGIRTWTPSANTQANKIDIDDELWAWLKMYSLNIESKPPIYLGYGLEDRFVVSSRLLGDILPPTQVMTVSGGHTWGPWLALWEQFLDRAPWANKALACKGVL
jgi:pimeloyl-ACP methyl ester carboxylesterase